MSNKTKNRKLPEFKFPPINETVYGVFFSQLPDLKAPYLGLLWEKFRVDYPKCDEMPRLIDEPSKISEQWLTPRVWFIHSDDSRIIQVQNDRFYYNWRRREKDYPNYEKVFPEFLTHFQIFNSFLKEHDLGEVVPINLELTYINHIPIGAAWNNLAEISSLFPDLGWRVNKERFLPDPENLSSSLRFLLPNGFGELIASFQTGRRTSDETPMLLLQLKAKGISEQGSLKNISEWFNIAHEWIVHGFDDLTSEDVKKNIWGKNDLA